MRRLGFIFGCALAAITAGCQSSVSTMLTRNESNTAWDRHQCLSGVPITLKVPTHVKVYIYDTYFLDTVDVGGVHRVQRIKLKYPVRDYAQEFIYTEKIFTVDFKRPAAGTFNLKLEMTQDQYISKVQHDVTDKTIEQVTALFSTLAPKGLFAGAVSLDSASIDGQIGTIKSVSAVGIFEIDAPDFEQQVTDFINHHLNQSHDAFVTEPHIPSIHRATVTFEGPLGIGPANNEFGAFAPPAVYGSDLVPTVEPQQVAPLPPVLQQQTPSSPAIRELPPTQAPSR